MRAPFALIKRKSECIMRPWESERLEGIAKAPVAVVALGAKEE